MPNSNNNDNNTSMPIWCPLSHRCYHESWFFCRNRKGLFFENLAASGGGGKKKKGAAPPGNFKVPQLLVREPV
jgi:hypothetical protein